jgi:hypothetical protein
MLLTRRRVPGLAGALVGLAAAALALGLVVARGGRWSFVAVGAIAMVFLGAIAAKVGLRAGLLAWASLSGLAYPFIRYPWHVSAYVDFDRIVVGALLVGLVFAPHFYHRSSTVARLSHWMAIFALLYGVAIIMEPSRTSFEAWLDQVILPAGLFWTALRTIKTSRDARSLAASLTFLGISVATLNVLEWRLHFELASWSGYSPFVDPYAHVIRVSGPYGDPTAGGSVLVLCLAATWYWWRTSKNRFGALALLIEAAGLIPTFTKTLWLGGLLAALVMLALGRKGGRLRLVAWFVGLSLAMTALAYALRGNSVIDERVFHSGNNFSARLGDFLQGWHFFLSHPIFGIGYGNFMVAQKASQTVYVLGQSAAMSPHNNLVVIAATNGVVGLVPYLCIIVLAALVIHGWRQQAESYEERQFGLMVVAAAVSYFVMSQTLVLLAYPPGTMVLALLLGAVSGRLNSTAIPITQHLAQQATPVESTPVDRRRAVL